MICQKTQKTSKRLLALLTIKMKMKKKCPFLCRFHSVTDFVILGEKVTKLICFIYEGELLVFCENEKLFQQKCFNVNNGTDMLPLDIPCFADFHHFPDTAAICFHQPVKLTHIIPVLPV